MDQHSAVNGWAHISAKAQPQASITFPQMRHGSYVIHFHLVYFPEN